jgi:hypothetical protein
MKSDNNDNNEKYIENGKKQEELTIESINTDEILFILEKKIKEMEEIKSHFGNNSQKVKKQKKKTK